MKQSKYDTNKDGVCDAKECSNLVMINRNTPVFADSEAVVVSSLAEDRHQGEAARAGLQRRLHHHPDRSRTRSRSR